MRCMKRGTLLLMLASVVMSSGIGGCNKTLFPENTPRSQYERYDALRGRERPTTEPGPYGVAQPALRERLRPLDQP